MRQLSRLMLFGALTAALGMLLYEPDDDPVRRTSFGSAVVVVSGREGSESVPPVPAIIAAETRPDPAGDSGGLAGLLGATWTSRGYVVGASTATGPSIGLRPGDLVVGVNGRDVGDPVRDLRLFQASRENGAAELAVMRQGQRLSVTIPL